MARPVFVPTPVLVGTTSESKIPFGAELIPKKQNGKFLRAERESVLETKTPLVTNIPKKQEKELPKRPASCGDCTVTKCLRLFHGAKTTFSINPRNFADTGNNLPHDNGRNGPLLFAPFAAQRMAWNWITSSQFLMVELIIAKTPKPFVVDAICLKLGSLTCRAITLN